MYEKSLDGFRPSARFDGTAWTQARVEGATTPAGPWTILVATTTLAPADPDPSKPIERAFTFHAAAEWPYYRVVFVDDLGAEETAGAVSSVDIDNRPNVDRLRRQLTAVDHGFDDDVLAEQLRASIAWVEDVCSTSFNGHQVTELYDGNTTNQIIVRKRPVTSIVLVTVETPILGFIRTYDQTEIKLYRKQGALKVFTYKLAVEQALFNTLDYQAWGTIFPPLPQCVHVNYTYGYPQYDPVTDTTTLDGGLTVLTGDQRDPEEINWLENMAQAAVLDAAAAVATMAGAKAGIVQGMSFDGYSRTLNPGAYQAQVQSWIGIRDERLKRRRRQFYLSSIG